MQPYYQAGGITIYHCDCLTFLDSPCHPQAVITDPPYGYEHYEHDIAIPAPYWQEWLNRTGMLAIFGYPEDLVGLCISLGRAPTEWVTWWPTNKMAARATTRLPKEHEAIAIFGSLISPQLITRPRATDRFCAGITTRRGNDVATARLGDVWRDPSPGMMFNSHLRLHPNEKPVSLMHRLVLLCSRQGDLVLDPCCGSGTTLIAAKNCGRRAVGIEINERHCEIAARRLSQEVLPLEAGGVL